MLDGRLKTLQSRLARRLALPRLHQPAGMVMVMLVLPLVLMMRQQPTPAALSAVASIVATPATVQFERVEQLERSVVASSDATEPKDSLVSAGLAARSQIFLPVSPAPAWPPAVATAVPSQPTAVGKAVPAQPTATAASVAPATSPASRRVSSRGNLPAVVVIDPGHGGSETGAEYATADGTPLVEEDLALKVSLAAAESLRAAGYRVILTRNGDYDPARGPGGGKASLVDNLQARNDIANAVNADVLVSVHFNAAGNAQRGTETFYNADRPYAADSRRLATLVQRNLLDTLRKLDYQPVDRGVKTDNKISTGGPLYILGAGKHIRRPSTMPGALGEALFISNPAEAALAQRDDVLAALGRAYANAVLQYFEGQP